MSILKLDVNEQKYRSLFAIPLSPHPSMPLLFIRYARNFFMSMNRIDLAIELDKKIKKEIEKPIGQEFRIIMNSFKNMPYLESYIKSVSPNPTYNGKKIYKWQIEKSIDEIMDWVYDKMRELEPEIRFADNKSLF